MCLMAFAIEADSACPLLIASNRDEYLDRPTEPLHRWRTPSGAEVLGGRDLRDGGTWLGLSPAGRVAMLTNVRDAHTATGRRSRGELVTRWLDGDLDWAALQAGLEPADYGGFNLVVGDFHQRFWGWLCNRHPLHPHLAHPPGLHARVLGPGVYGLSNAALNTPWPKTQRLVQAVQEALAQAAEPDGPWLQALTEALGDDRQTPDEALPQTGMPIELERGLSSPFVRLQARAYGTRSSLVVRVSKRQGMQPAAQAGSRWHVSLDEWTHVQGPAAPAAGADAWSRAQHRQETLDW